jgi:hypothetical protein
MQFMALWHQCMSDLCSAGNQFSAGEDALASDQAKSTLTEALRQKVNKKGAAS